MEFSDKNTGVVSISYSRDCPKPEIKLRSPALQADALLSEPLYSPNAFFFLNFLLYWSIVDEQCSVGFQCAVIQLYMYRYIFFFEFFFC